MYMHCEAETRTYLFFRWLTCELTAYDCIVEHARTVDIHVALESKLTHSLRTRHNMQCSVQIRYDNEHIHDISTVLHREIRYG